MFVCLSLLFALHFPAVVKLEGSNRSSAFPSSNDVPLVWSLWSTWSGWTACSRHCGGGVSKRMRVCLHDDFDDIWNNKPSNGKTDVDVVCPGDARKYKSCNTQPCNKGEADFRELQCSLFNVLQFHGKHYDWIPCTSHYDYASAKKINPCALNCYPDGHDRYITFSDSVVDGTPCLLDNGKSGVCADGTCLATGCNKLIGSTLEYDKCGVCGGNGNSCFTTTAKYKNTISTREGARNIQVLQTRQTKSHLTVFNPITFEAYINGNWTIDPPGLYNIAGTIFDYSRDVPLHTLKQYGLESLHALGPTTCPLIILILTKRRGHQFHRFNISYTRPNEDYGAKDPSLQSVYYPHQRYWRSRTNPLPTMKQAKFKENFMGFDDVKLPIELPINHSIALPQWVKGPVSSCSKSCGGGIKTITFQCRQGIHLLHNSACNSTVKPHNRTKHCNTMDCPPSWEYGSWSSCSRTCGNGVKTRTAKCRQTASTVATQTISSEWCRPRVHKLASNCCLCAGDGMQKLPSKCCSPSQPITKENCYVQRCWGKWKVNEWQPCSNVCENAFQYRDIDCLSNKTGQQLPSSDCNPETQPASKRLCKPSPACVTYWYTGAWGPCSVKCGKGVHTRKISCYGQVNSSGSITHHALPSKMCDSRSKSKLATKNCTKHACSPDWVTGSWSQCSKTCHTDDHDNYQQRTVECMTDGRSSPGECDLASKPYKYKHCAQSSPCSRRLDQSCVDRHPVLCFLIQHPNYWKYKFCSAKEIRRKCCKTCLLGEMRGLVGK
ncbi:A disintegrin and metalloproteinase with thrombospondin motifs 16-like isoform X2 [Corticium candelabrum]|uniref:A disintegrin and metalloproteinase with thrombospondin motifs 16-like isoform X2 n=1 Tax=Corticium candelabrum TaxID=121492 RepID=UPI002E274341|nr:A disintegrin and metalloproteinase with thrombospondin motifs 16-like isoform X2 [Corticium candelabrum]